MAIGIGGINYNLKIGDSVFGNWHIQTCFPPDIKKYGLEELRFGDLVAIRDHYDVYGTGRYGGAVTIGVVIHGFSSDSGHGPGMNAILSASSSSCLGLSYNNNHFSPFHSFMISAKHPSPLKMTVP